MKLKEFCNNPMITGNPKLIPIIKESDTIEKIIFQHDHFVITLKNSESLNNGNLSLSIKNEFKDNEKDFFDFILSKEEVIIGTTFNQLKELEINI